MMHEADMSRPRAHPEAKILHFSEAEVLPDASLSTVVCLVPGTIVLRRTRTAPQ